MSYRTILLELVDDAENDARIECAKRLAQQFDAELVGIHVSPPPFLPVGFGEGAAYVGPEVFEAHFNLGNIHHDHGQYLDAETCYRDALALKPDYPDAHFYLAVTLEKMGRSSEARMHWRDYQMLAPEGEWVELAREFSD